MNKDIAKLWVDALRSGKYPQAKEVLCSNEGYCCLGVLCELAVEAGVIPPGREPTEEEWSDNAGDLPDVPNDIEGVIAYDGYATMPSVKVQGWAGLKTSIGSFMENTDTENTYTCLASKNDGGATFAEIADIIESKVDEL